MVEEALGRFQTSYLDSPESDFSSEEYDLICIDEEIYDAHQSSVMRSETPVLLISAKKSHPSRVQLTRPVFVKEWLETIKSIIKPVRTPELISLVVGAIVRSKSTPFLGKGIVLDAISENEFLVSFPKSRLAKLKGPIRCHKTQLQVLGNISDVIKKAV